MEQTQPPLSSYTAQRTDEWHRLRLGKITSSMEYVLMSSKGYLNGTSLRYLNTRLMELLTCIPKGFSSKQTEHGNDWEPFVKQQLATRYNSDFSDCVFVQHPTLIYLGGSPDGIIQIGGIPTTSEIKCPVYEEALVNRKAFKSVEACRDLYPEVYWQCQGNMILQGTAQALATSFHPGLPPNIMYSELIIPLNSEDKTLLLSRAAQAYEWMLEEAKDLGLDIPARYKEIMLMGAKAEDNTI